MQTEVPTLPVVCSDGQKRSTRNPDTNAGSSLVVETKNNSLCKTSSYIASNRKQLHPLVGGPYRNSMRLYALSEPVRATNKTSVGQRVMSAKMLRVKQLQNQLTDAHYHLNELANENRLLKALQKRQDAALKRYEGTNAELPRIINSHHEELKVLQTKHKKLKTQHKHTCDLLKEKENEIHALQSQNKHLIQLSKDRHLEERDKLQMRVSDLNFRIEQQQETIQTLNRKLALESKSLKHQLNAEVAKHKETQKNLHEALDKLKTLEDLLDNREKRLYYSGRLPVCNKGKAMTSQSLLNLGNNGLSTNPPRSGSKSRCVQNDTENGSLPQLTRTESNEGKSIPILKVDQAETTGVTETMSSLQQVRKFRLQKSYSRSGSAGLSHDFDKSDDEEQAPKKLSSGGFAKSASLDKLKAKRAVLNDRESDNEEIKKFVDDFELTNGKGPYKLPKQLRREFGYSSSESDSDADTKTGEELESMHDSESLTNKSRELHNRLTSGNAAFPEAKKLSKNKSPASTSDSECDSETEIKIALTTKDSYSVALRRGSAQGVEGNHSSLSVDDFLKLDINATDSDLEMERLRKTKASHAEKTSEKPLDSFLAEGYESSQQKLMTITKSWTELQEKIKREREISENQLKAMNEASLADAYLLENNSKLSVADETFFLEKSRTFSVAGNNENEKYKESHEVTPKIVNQSDKSSAETAVEIPYEQQNGIIRDSEKEENELSLKIKAELAKDSKTSTKNVEQLTNALPQKPEESLEEKIGIANGEIDAASAEIKVVNYNKQKLLAAMKAIDNNENIELLSSEKNRVANAVIRSQTTISDNLYRGLPSHARKKNDIMKELFGDSKAEKTKLRAGCSKLH